MNEPVTVGVATIVSVETAPLARLPNAHVRFCVPLHTPPGEEETKLKPAARLSVTVTFVAIAGPEFVTTMR